MACESGVRETMAMVTRPGRPHCGGVAPLPSPGLQIRGLSETLAFPLSCTQAAQLTQFARTNEHGKVLSAKNENNVECVHLSAGAISFANPEWEVSVTALKNVAVKELGLSGREVGIKLEKLVLYGRGRGFGIVTDGLGKLVVQLPSAFEGAGIGLWYGGWARTGEVYETGRGALCSSHYCAAFGDIKWEMGEVKEGFRVVLVYDLQWKGAGRMPCAGENYMMDNLAYELREEAAMGDGVWKLVFELWEQYEEEAIAKLGVDALQRDDRRSVFALQAAAKMEQMGDVEVLLCVFERTDTERYLVDQHVDHSVCYSACTEDYELKQFDPEVAELHSFHRGPLILRRVYRADGTPFNGNLSFIDWDCHLRYQDFMLMHAKNKGAVETHGDLAIRKVNKRGTAFVMWPREKSVDVLSLCKDNMAFLLSDAKPCEYDPLVTRILAALRARRRQDVAESILVLVEFCLKHRLALHASAAVDVAASIASLPLVKNMELVRAFGSPIVGEAVQRALCKSGAEGFAEIDTRIRALHSLCSDIPEHAAYDMLRSIVKLAQDNRGALAEQPKTLPRDKDGSDYRIPLLVQWDHGEVEPHDRDPDNLRLWSALFASFDTLYGRLVDKGYMSALDDLVFWLIKLCNTLSEERLATIDSALTGRGRRKGVGVLSKLCLAVRVRLFTLRTTRFLEETAYIVQHKAIPFLYRRRETRHHEVAIIEDWCAFFLFARSVLCDETVVVAECVKRFRYMLCAFGCLSPKSLDGIKALTSSVYSHLEKDEKKRVFITAVKDAVNHVEGTRKEKKLLERIHMLQEKAASEPLSYDRRMPNVKALLQGAETSTKLKAYAGVGTAPRTHGKLRVSLPHSVEGSTGGVAHESYTRLQKLLEGDRAAWVKHQQEVQELQQARDELKGVQRRLCRKGSSDGESRQAKRRKADALPLDDDIEIVAENVVLGKRVSVSPCESIVPID